MKQFTTLILALLFGTLASWADDFNLYYDASASADHVKLAAVGDIQKLTFADGEMTIVTTSGTTTTLPVASMQRLFFSTDSTVGVGDVQEAQPTDRQEPVIYDLAGRRILSAPDQLAKGIYIINGKKATVK